MFFGNLRKNAVRSKRGLVHGWIDEHKTVGVVRQQISTPRQQTRPQQIRSQQSTRRSTSGSGRKR